MMLRKQQEPKLSDNLSDTPSKRRTDARRRATPPTLPRLAVLCAGALLLSSAALPVSPEWVAKWDEDLEWAHGALLETHPDPFTRITPAELEERFERLADELPTLEHHEIAVRLMEIVAALGDGHTRLTLPVPADSGLLRTHGDTDPPHLAELEFHDYPIRLALDGSGLRVRSAAAPYADAVGNRVVRLGRLEPAAAIERVAPTVRHDNEMQLLDLLPAHLVTAEVLHARGVTETLDRLPLTVETAGGETLELELPPRQPGTPADRVEAGGVPTASEPGEPGGPAASREPGRFERPRRPQGAHPDYWLAWMARERVVYFRFDQVGSREGETLAAFAGRLERFLAEYPAEALVIDLRRNFGGWHDTTKPLLRTLIRDRRVNRTGRLFALIGRTTFSAAMMFAIDLEKHTDALFVGEPTGSSPNHFGDSARRVLPNTGLTMRISTLYWQYSDPRDRRPAIAPHFPAAASFEAEVAGRDPALELVLDLVAAGGGPLSGDWRGTMTPPYQELELRIGVTASSRGHEITAGLPALGIEGAALTEVAAEPGRLEGTLELDRGELRRLRLEGTVRGDWLVGEAHLETDLGPYRFPFVLRRGPRPGPTPGP